MKQKKLERREMIEAHEYQRSPAMEAQTLRPLPAVLDQLRQEGFTEAIDKDRASAPIDDAVMKAVLINKMPVLYGDCCGVDGVAIYRVTDDVVLLTELYVDDQDGAYAVIVVTK